MALGITWPGLLSAAVGQFLVVAAITTFCRPSCHVPRTVGFVLAGDAVIFCLLAAIAAAFRHVDLPEQGGEALLVHLVSAAVLAWVTWGLAVHVGTGRAGVWAGGSLLVVTFVGLTAPGIRTSKSGRPAQVILVSVGVPGLPAELEGFRILLLSDTHVGPWTDEAEARARLRPVGQVKADMIVFTGDLASGEKLGIDKAASLIDQLAPSGPRFAVLGNHEHYLDPRLATTQLTRRGFRVLNNRSETVGVNGRDIWIVGVDDPVGSQN